MRKGIGTVEAAVIVVTLIGGVWADAGVVRGSPIVAAAVAAGAACQGATFPASAPLDVVADPSTGNAYVTDTGASSLSVFNAVTDSPTPTAVVGVGEEPRRVAVDDQRDLTYVTNYDAGTISVLTEQDGTWSTVAAIPVGSEPDNATVDTTTGLVYITLAGGDAVAVLDPSSMEVTGTIPVGTSPDGDAYDPDNGDVYVANSGSASVSVINTATATVVATIPISNSHPHGVTVEPSTSTVWVALNTNTIVGINDVRNAIAGPRRPAGSGTHHIAIDAGGDLFVTDWAGGSVTELAPAGRILRTIHTCDRPDGISYDPANDNLYVACAGGDTVVVLSDPSEPGGERPLPTEITSLHPHRGLPALTAPPTPRS